MRCPRCRAENPDGSRYCLTCGALLPKESRFKKFLMACLRGVLYVALFYVIQLIVGFAFEFFMLLPRMAPRLLAGGTFTEQEMLTLAEEVTAAANERLHTLTLLSGLITVLVLTLSCRLRKKEPLRELCVSPLPLNRAPFCVLFGIAVQPVVLFLINFLPAPLLENYEKMNPLTVAGDPLYIELLDVVF